MNKVIAIAEAVKEAGGRALLVGGYVRDKYLGLKSKDYDIEVFGIQPQKLIDILKNIGDVCCVGESFGVLKLDNEIDVSMPRRERKTGKGYKGFKISVDPFMSYKEACKRRDLTINAMMLDPLSGELIDPYNGLESVKYGVLHHVNDATFTEDPLRVLRVAQFKARLGFTVASNTSNLCAKIMSELGHLSRERVYIEFEKLLMKADKPSIGFNWLSRIGVLEWFFPELNVLHFIEQGPKYHPEGNCFEHTMLAIDSVPMEDRTMTNMLAVLLHDTGKATCISEVDEEDPTHIHFSGHAECGIETAKSFLNRITTETKLKQDVVALVANHMQPYQLKKHMRKKSIRRLALKVAVPNLLIVHRADKNGRLDEPDLSYVDDIANIYNEIKDEIHPILKGRHLIDSFAMVPGPYFGPILKEAFEAQLNEEFSTEEEGLDYLAAIFDSI